MESEARYKLVGAVLLALALAIASSLVWLERTGRRADFQYYTIYFDHASLDGLQVGGDVDMRGIKVGRVEDYSISRDNINRVKATIRIERKAPVSENTVATISRNVLTGLATVNLVTSGTPGSELTRIAEGERFPVIPEGDSRELTASIDRLALAGAGALDSLDQLLNKENREAFAATLANMRQVSGKLDAAVDALAGGSAELGKSSRQVAAAVDRAVASAQPVASQAQLTLRDLSNAAHALERETAAIAHKVDGAADSSALEISATTQELRATAEIFARAADRLKDPRAAILGPGRAQLGPGETLP